MRGSEISVSKASLNTSLSAKECAEMISDMTSGLQDHWTVAAASLFERSYHRHKQILRNAQDESCRSRSRRAWSSRNPVSSSAWSKSHTEVSKNASCLNKRTRYKESRALNNRKGTLLSLEAHSVKMETSPGTEENVISNTDYKQTIDAAEGMILFGAFKQGRQPPSEMNDNHTCFFKSQVDMHKIYAAGRQIPEGIDLDRLAEAYFAAFRHPFISEGIFFTFCELFMRHAMIDAEGLEEELASLKIDPQSEKSVEHQIKVLRQTRDRLNDQDAEMHELEL